MSGNGVDLAAIYQAIIALSNRIGALEAEMRSEFRAVRAEIRDVRAEVVDLRQTVNDYHGSVMGHGMLITELDERVTRLEQQRQA